MSKRKLWFGWVLVSMLSWAIGFTVIALGVTACQPITIPYLAANGLLPPTPLTIRSTPREVIALMLNSHTRWRTLQAKATSGLTT